jgi:hypothetical protein
MIWLARYSLGGFQSRAQRGAGLAGDGSVTQELLDGDVEEAREIGKQVGRWMIALGFVVGDAAA